MDPASKKFEKWLEKATRGLDGPIRERLRLELHSHYEDGCADLARAGASTEEAECEALKALGTAEEAGAHFRREYPVAPPWAALDFLPGKPAGSEYGYLKGNKLVDCSREELIGYCRANTCRMVLAWTPETEKLAPVEGIPFLFEAIRKGRVRDAINQLGAAAALAVITILEAHRLEWPWRHLLALVIAIGILPLVMWLKVLREAWSLKPIQLAKQAEHSGYPIWAEFHKPRITIGLMLLISITTITGWIADGNAYPAAAGVDRAAMLKGEWWRLITSAASCGFMEIGVVLVVLFVLGGLIERVMGMVHPVLLYFSSAVAGGIMGILANSSMFVSASAGAMGMAGFVIALPARELPMGKEQKESVAKMVSLVAVFGLLCFEEFHHASLLGGLLWGLMLGRLTKDPKKVAKSAWLKWAAAIAAVCLVLGACGSIFLGIS